MACKNDGFSTPEFRYDVSGIWTTFKFEYPKMATIQYEQNATQKSDQKMTKANRKMLFLNLLKGIPTFQEKRFLVDWDYMTAV